MVSVSTTSIMRVPSLDVLRRISLSPLLKASMRVKLQDGAATDVPEIASTGSVYLRGSHSRRTIRRIWF